MIDIDRIEQLAKPEDRLGPPATTDEVLALIAEVRNLRAKLQTPIAMKIKWSPMESTMIDGWSPEVAEDALSRGKKVTVYYGKTLDVQRGAK